VQITRETPHGLPAVRVIASVPAGQRRPRERELGRDLILAARLEVVQELQELPLGGHQLVAKRPADRQILDKCVA
jgi:hypothetical protein